MYVIGALIIVVIIYFYLSNKNESSAPLNDEISTRPQRIEETFLPPIPNGYQIFAQDLPVAGMFYRTEEAMNFAMSSNQELMLEREPSNKFDTNAIKLIGLSGATQYFIGYLPKELSAQIIGTDMFEKVKARLASIHLSGGEYLDIEYQLIGPKVDKKKFDEFLKIQPANSSQKNYFKFFKLPIPRGLNVGQAEQIIVEHKKTSTSEEQENYEAYFTILEEFDDKGFRSDNYLKKVSKVVLLEAINNLKAEGKTYSYLAENIDEVVDKVIELKPDLEKDD